MQARVNPLALVAVREPGAAVLDDRSDDELMLMSRGGMQSAFDLLVRRHQAWVLHVAVRYLGDAALAKDVAQNTFLELYRNLERYERRDKFRAFLCRIVLNQGRMTARAARSSVRLRAPLTQALEMNPQSLLAREFSRDLQLALERLGDKHRTVVILRYCEDLDLPEISEIVGIPVGTVKSRLFDAMAKLREMLGGEA
jgi:RNA polymerase sigma-70 factor (ECF subfamily)